MKLGLGTAQFGMHYGISNRHGKVARTEVPAILAFAKANDVSLLDTAPAYGDSESVLGDVLPESGPFRLVTKMSARLEGQQGRALFLALSNQLHESLRKLRQESVYGYLIHNARDLMGERGSGIIEALSALREKSLVEKIGVSVYTPEDLHVVLDRFVPDIVQLPLSVFNQRFLDGATLARLKRRGVEIHARSIFMQGLVLMETDELKDSFSSIREHHRAFCEFVRDAGLTRLEAALAFVASIPEIDIGLVGISGMRELQQIVDAVTRNAKREVRINISHKWAINDEKIINPSLWPGA